MKLFVLDTETSDLDPQRGAEVLELAWMELELVRHYWTPTCIAEYYIEHKGEVSPHARAVHHISSEKLKLENGAVPRREAFEFLVNRVDLDVLMVAHNAAFDSKFFRQITRPWICTMRAAKHIWPEAPGYSNQVLRYWLGLDIYKFSPLIQQRYPHQALYDVATTTGLLLKMLENHTPEQLLMMSSRPAKMTTIGFGEHKGKKFSDIPHSYLSWLRRTTKDEDLKFTLDSLLK